MFDCQTDVSYRDFNPTVLFASKLLMTKQSTYHSHEDFTELTYILSGKGRYLVEGRSYDVEAGDLIVCNPFVRHQKIVTENYEPTVEFFTGFSEYHFINMQPNRIELPGGEYMLRLSSSAKEGMHKICYEMLAENEKNQVGKYFMLKTYLMQLLLILLREIIEPPKERQLRCDFENYNKTYVVKRMLQYLTGHFEQKISLDQIAQNMYLSPVYISKIFKEEMGESPINYLIKIRLERAREILLQNQKDSIKCIANEVGYEDVYHFSKLFKKHYGVSPLYYRRNCMEPKEGQKNETL